MHLHTRLAAVRRQTVAAWDHIYEPPCLLHSPPILPPHPTCTIIILFDGRQVAVVVTTIACTQTRTVLLLLLLMLLRLLVLLILVRLLLILRWQRLLLLWLLRGCLRLLHGLMLLSRLRAALWLTAVCLLLHVHCRWGGCSSRSTIHGHTPVERGRNLLLLVGLVLVVVGGGMGWLVGSR